MHDEAVLVVGAAGGPHGGEPILRASGDTEVAGVLRGAIVGHVVVAVRRLVRVRGRVDVQFGVAPVGTVLVQDRGVQELGDQPVPAAVGRHQDDAVGRQEVGVGDR